MASEWVSSFYSVVAWVGAFTALAVAHLTWHDVINSMDAKGVQIVRFAILHAIGGALLWSTVAEWDRSPIALGLVTIGVCSLLNNAMALYLRQPPRERLGHRTKAPERVRSGPPPLPRISRWPAE